MTPRGGQRGPAAPPLFRQNPPQLLRVIDGPALADDRDLDLARIFELVLDLAGDLVREEDGGAVVDLLRLDEYADLAPGLEGVDAIDAFVAGGDVLERLHPLDVLLQALAPRARPRSRDRVGRDQQHGLDRLRLDFVVVGFDRVDDGRRLAVAARVLGREERMRAFDLVRQRLADVV